MLWSIFCGNLSKAFSLSSGLKKEARRNFSYLLLQLTQLKICTKYYMEIDNYSVGLGYLKSFNSSCSF